jgi:hypothetical protein
LKCAELVQGQILDRQVFFLIGVEGFCRFGRPFLE